MSFQNLNNRINAKSGHQLGVYKMAKILEHINYENQKLRVFIGVKSVNPYFY